MITARDKLLWVQSELALRKSHVYGRAPFVDEAHEIAVMEAIVHDYANAFANEEAAERMKAAGVWL
jgi:hypothetical protein